MSAKVPRTPPGPLEITPADCTAYMGPLWRICRTAGAYTRPWNEGRDFGPLVGHRWDPHRPPPSEQRDRRVLYAATEIATAAAEVWQVTRRIDVELGRPVVVRATPTRPLKLLDLTDNSAWTLRAGAAAALPYANRGTCRAWSRAILDAAPKLDGLMAPSTMTGRPNIVLYRAGIAALPDSPDLSRAAEEPAVRTLLEAIAGSLGYRM